MRKAVAIAVSLLTAVLVFVLDRPLGALPALGRLLDPLNGWAANAEATGKSFNATFHLKGLQQPVSIWLEARLVPHIRAANDHDLYLAQGYIHAYFRLWQMDFQTRAAAGRISEVVSPKILKDETTGKPYDAVLKFDRTQRRKGMVYAAENSLRAIEAEPRTKGMLDAYTEGVNAYIHSLSYRDYPLEYKLMAFAPEDWTNLKAALLMKYMADDLTGNTDDIAYTYLRDALSPEEFDFLYPERLKGSKPVIPEGTPFAKPSLAMPAVPGNPDSLFSHFNKSQSTASTNSQSEIRNPESGIQEGIGSNNWAISGTHTASGAPILCNDPHLGLNLPSLWFETQLTAPGINVYGASLPGAPGIVIGFNDSISWGVTNNYRDVKDFYEIAPADAGSYWFDGVKKPYQTRIERIGQKGGGTYLDTVRYTVHGPVMYDADFEEPSGSRKELAVCWMAHRPTNELLALYQLNRAQDYNSFVAAIMHFQCPAQNFVYADRANNIAMWGQGQFINKWKGQGKFVMEGHDSKTLWGQDIPMSENPHALNPAQGYLASANQSVTDSTYPYWYNGMFTEARSWRINQMLDSFNVDTSKQQKPLAILRARTDIGDSVTTNRSALFWDCGEFKSRFFSMAGMQNDVHSILADQALSILGRNISYSQAGLEELLRDLGERGSFYGKRELVFNSSWSTAFQIWFYYLNKIVWENKFPASLPSKLPSTERTIQILKDNDSLFRVVSRNAFESTHDSLRKLLHSTGTEWYQVKNTTLTHLAKIPAFSYDQLKIGGWANTINACTGNHGPSWRMIVEMGKDSIRAYGVYPGGQSGNPGSPYYSDFIDNWVGGKYFPLRFLAAATAKNPFSYTMILTP